MSDTLVTLKRRRTVALIVVFAVVAVAVAMAFVVRGSRLPKRFAVVAPGVLYRSSQPSAAQVEHLAGPDGPGIRTIVIAREGDSPRVAAEIEAAIGLGVKVVHIPIESRKPIPAEQIEQFFRQVDDPACRPILVHCAAGRHRTGYLCALYRIERQGWSVEQAIDEALSFGFDTDSQTAVLEQLKQYKPKRQATTGSSAVGAP